MLGPSSWPVQKWEGERALPASAGGITEGRYTPTKSRNPTLRRLWSLLRTAVRPRPSSPRFRGGIEMAVIRHRGKLIPIGGHRNGIPVFILVCVPHDSPVPRFIQVAPEFEGNPRFIKEPTHLSQ